MSLKYALVTGGSRGIGKAICLKLADMGIWSCIGISIEEVKDSLYQGKSGIGLEPERWDYGCQSALTGIVPKPSLKGVLDRHLRRGPVPGRI